MNWNEFKNIFSEAELIEDKIVIKTNPAKILEYIKNHYNFDLLKEIIAVDNKENGIELTYHLFSTEDEEDVYVAINVKDEVETVTDVYDSARADEKEIYDLFGVKFVRQ